MSGRVQCPVATTLDGGSVRLGRARPPPVEGCPGWRPPAARTGRHAPRSAPMTPHRLRGAAQSSGGRRDGRPVPGHVTVVLRKSGCNVEDRRFEEGPPNDRTAAHMVRQVLKRSHKIRQWDRRSHKVRQEVTRSLKIKQRLRRSHKVRPELMRSHKVRPEVTRSHKVR